MSAGRTRVELRARAKVNLSLAVLGKRPDGFHELDTSMLALELADRLVLRPRAQPGVGIALRGPFASADIPADASNLAARAAGEVLRRSGRAGGISIELEKQIPSGSGLGGGSSDAAAAWIGACELLGFDPGNEATQAGLAALGSDCVFFWKAAETGFARCLGRGERVEPAPAPPAASAVALIVPAVACPTAKVYGAFSAADPAAKNQLERAALAAVPELGAWRKALDSGPFRHWQLSGSGSSFFALHAELRSARAELEALEGLLARQGLAPRLALACAAGGGTTQILRVV
ncbi:MAG: 4-(cytidine 5'-diphospho)-2-C-methyl-D-erythritol kinase [Planctomycetes bacterium]|nr:4-(cytidine 5'-diphospho)-2-C-methyl-D-erythritol kinase [Planctomycetota bacterium]